ncbi:MAG: tetratricopeptide repeat protein [Pyrinomonadaceae bacterium]
MSFDKIKVMRNAERFLSQGKIRAAISEYQRVVENDPKDFSTLNILGDLYMKSSEKHEAVGCFTQVAEHYNTQGFAHKAIAIYNKISRIEPNSMEVSAKLAQLYQSKGSVSEARTHYTALAEQYQRTGRKIEALAIWKQIAELDPNNTDIYLKIAEVCWQEDQHDEAAKAFTEAGLRLTEQEQYEEALAAFSKALEVKKNYLRALNGLVKAQIGLGFADEAAKILEGILEEQPFNRDILYLLVDCYLDMDNPAEAERAVVKLVEQEPANYPKFLDLVKVYLKNNDLNAAARILSMSSEHLLVGGQAEDFFSWTNEILARNPEQLDALRLLVRYYGWQRDESEIKTSLERLAETARLLDAVEDERYALSQLVMIVPQEGGYAQRLQEINIAHGFTAADFSENEKDSADTPLFENFSVMKTNTETNGHSEEFYNGNGEFDFADEADTLAFQADDLTQNGFSESVKEFSFYNDEAVVVENKTDSLTVEAETVEAETVEAEKSTGELKLADELELQKEIESVEFYIAQGYRDLAEKTLDTLEEEYGNQAKFGELRLQLDDSLQTLATNTKPANAEIIKEETAEVSSANELDPFNDLRNELGFEDKEASAENDYETHYHTAVAYQEMGLMEDAIREFQDAINLVTTDDGTRRFFQCSNLLGHCFMEKQMPNLALMWFKRCLEVPGLSDDEKQALYYELGSSYEVGGDREKAIAYFEKLYVENVDFRDVGKRLENLQKDK